MERQLGSLRCHRQSAKSLALRTNQRSCPVMSPIGRSRPSGLTWCGSFASRCARENRVPTLSKIFVNRERPNQDTRLGPAVRVRLLQLRSIVRRRLAKKEIRQSRTLGLGGLRSRGRRGRRPAPSTCGTCAMCSRFSGQQFPDSVLRVRGSLSAPCVVQLVRCPAFSGQFSTGARSRFPS